jgi:hypothetical protein
MGLSPLRNRKARAMAGFFFLDSISSVYHVERGKPAKILLIVSSLLSPKVTLGKWWKLDKKGRVWSLEFGV